jgi:hypothetical protein
MGRSAACSAGRSAPRPRRTCGSSRRASGARPCARRNCAQRGREGGGADAKGGVRGSAAVLAAARGRRPQSGGGGGGRAGSPLSVGGARLKASRHAGGRPDDTSSERPASAPPGEFPAAPPPRCRRCLLRWVPAVGPRPRSARACWAGEPAGCGVRYAGAHAPPGGGRRAAAAQTLQRPRGICARAVARGPRAEGGGGAGLAGPGPSAEALSLQGVDVRWGAPAPQAGAHPGSSAGAAALGRAARARLTAPARRVSAGRSEVRHVPAVEGAIEVRAEAVRLGYRSAGAAAPPGAEELLQRMLDAQEALLPLEPSEPGVRAVRSPGGGASDDADGAGSGEAVESADAASGGEARDWRGELARLRLEEEALSVSLAKLR